ncbi:MAG: oligosaccharide flippase family protein [Caldilineaceae bacterium]
MLRILNQSVRAIFGRNNTADVVRLLSGSSLAQVISLLSAPIIARLYAPDVFGTLSLFTSVIAIVGVVACLRYEHAIMIVDSDHKALNLLAISLAFAAIVSVLTAFIMWLISPTLVHFYNISSIQLLNWSLPTGVFWTGTLSAFTYWSLRNSKFNLISMSRISGASVTASISLGLGLKGLTDVTSLIFANVGGTIIAALAVSVPTWTFIWRSDQLHLKAREFIADARQFKSFPIYDSRSTLLNTFSWQLPSLLLNAFFAPAIAGYYALGFRILQLPMSLLGTAIGQVFYQRASHANMEGSLVSLVQTSFHKLVIISLFPMLILALLGRDIFIVVFGSNWAEAGTYVQLLSPWAFFWFISSPLSTIFNVLQRQRHLLTWNIQNFLWRFVALVVGGFIGNPRISVFLFSLAGIILYSYITVEILHISGVSLATAMRILIMECLFAAPSAFVLFLTATFALPSTYKVAIALIVYTIYVALRVGARSTFEM